RLAAALAVERRRSAGGDRARRPAPFRRRRARRSAPRAVVGRSPTAAPIRARRGGGAPRPARRRAARSAASGPRALIASSLERAEAEHLGERAHGLAAACYPPARP